MRPMLLAVLLMTAAACCLAEPWRENNPWKRWERPRYDRNFAFRETLAECALPKEELPNVVEGHPRLLIRAKPWAGGLSVAQLRQRAKAEPWARMLQGSRWRSVKYAVNCAIYHLITRDASVVGGLVEYVLKARPGWKCGGSLVSACMVYDYLCGAGVATAEQKQRMREHIAKVAFECAKAQESGTVNDMWHHRGAAGWVSDVLVAGLVLHGEHPEADRLLAWGAGYFHRNYFPGWARTGGTHMGGGHRYYRAGAGRMPMTVAIWQSATSDDVCSLIRRKYNDFVQGNMYAMMYQTLPDRTRVESTGFDYAPKHLMKGNYLVTSWAYKNPDGYAFAATASGATATIPIRPPSTSSTKAASPSAADSTPTTSTSANICATTTSRPSRPTACS